MRFLPSMDPNVILKVASLGKCLITFLAVMRFLPSMDLNVFLYITTMGNCFITFLALMWFLLIVDPIVIFQDAGLWRH